MSQDEQAFMDIIAEYDQYSNDVDLSFKPAEIGAGEYTVFFRSFSLNTISASDVENSVARATFEIVGGERDGDSFRDEFWFPRGLGKANMAQRGLLILARCLSGNTVKTLSDAIRIVKAAAEEGAALLVSIEPSKSRKTGTVFFNVNYKNTVAAEAVPTNPKASG